MPLPTAVVVLAFGEDDFLIGKYIASLVTDLGDATTAGMNTTRLEAAQFSPDTLRAAASPAPFLAPRRLVIVNRALGKLSTPEMQKKLTDVLDQLPSYSLVVLVEPKAPGKNHWLSAWQMQARVPVQEKILMIEKGKMGEWIMRQAKAAGGEFTPRGAAMLASLSENDTRFANQEIQKLLAYVNYRRAVDYEDVEQLTISISQGDIFALVDALGHQDGRKALATLRRLMEEQELLSIMGMVVRQFRLLIQVRDVIDQGTTQEELAHLLRLHPYVAGKLAVQARRFTRGALERAYHQLVELDFAIKTGLVEDETGLETWVAGFTI